MSHKRRQAAGHVLLLHTYLTICRKHKQATLLCRTHSTKAFAYSHSCNDCCSTGMICLISTDMRKLWKFHTERCRHKHVTLSCWNPQYNDLFAVGYGSFDFLRQSSGLVCCYSLKNPSYPEYAFGTDSGKGCGCAHLPPLPLIHNLPGVQSIRLHLS